MRARRVLVPDAMDDGYFALIVQLLDGPHLGIEGQLAVDGQNLVFGDADLGPGVPIMPVGVGDDGVQVVVGAGHLQHHHHRILLGSSHHASPYLAL